MKNLWILTEERPKKEVVSLIIRYFAKDKKIKYSLNDKATQIIPLLDKDFHFNFTYCVKGFSSPSIGNIYIKIISGSSSFVDYLVFCQENEPTQSTTPLYAIEVTKTDDEESRNTGIDQRITKFIYLDYYYPKIKKIMLFYSNIKHNSKKRTATYIFGFRILRTLNVIILRNSINPSTDYAPFSSIEEVIEQKNNMTEKAGNVSVRIKKTTTRIEISGKLLKHGRLAYDPNIGLLTGISAVLRKLGWKKNITITRHELTQNLIGKRNKFVIIANLHKISLKNLSIPAATPTQNYWSYEEDGEKLGTIFIHLVVESFSNGNGYSIFENHAGCEKGYFQTLDKQYLALQKYEDRDAYKKGDKSKIIFIPDLVLLDKEKKEVLTIEGKTSREKEAGIRELKNYDSFERIYVKPHYRGFSMIRKVVLYGGEDTAIKEVSVAFLLNRHGQLVLRTDAPSLFQKAIRNLLSYWRASTRTVKK